MQDIDHQHVVWRFLIDGERFTKLKVPDDDGTAADAQRVRDPGYDEDQADTGIDQDVAEGVDAAVARASGMASVLSSNTLTNPGGSPFGETSTIPPAPADATKTKGAWAMKRRAWSSITCTTLATERSVG